MKGRSTAAVLLLLGGLLSLDLAGSAPQRGGDREKVRREEREDYYKKWLSEDVFYIISPEEKNVFEKLQTDEEKEQFIEQFWIRRDPDPLTAENEFKEEHYRRIAYANERFSSGLPGWFTDRGRIYIIHGPPAEIESHPSGGAYQRPFSEGGGQTSTYPFEVWRYRYIEGVGNDVILEFVDPTMSGEYRLALRPEEKDALLYVPGAGLTMAESMGLADKADRPYFSPGNTNYPFESGRARDSAFQRYETYTMVQRPTQLKYKDLQSLVEVNISYDNLPFELRQDYFRINESRALVPITLKLDHKNLMFVDVNQQKAAQVAVYGIVTSIANRVVTEFEDDLVTTLDPEDFQRGLAGSSIYQKILLLESRGRYKLDLVIKDLNSASVGVKRQALVPPVIEDDNLTVSSVILSDFVRQLGETPKENQMFVLGDVWIRPSLDREFSHRQSLNVYFQLYNAGVDQTTLGPSLGLRYVIFDGEGQPVVDIREESGESIQFFSGQRVVLIKQFSLEKFPAGDYRLLVSVRDLIKSGAVEINERFKVKESQIAASR